MQNDRTLDGDKKALDHRIPTRWNSDFACLDAHVYFKAPVEQLTAVTANKLSTYQLSAPQWDLAHKLSDILAVTNLFTVFSTINANLHYYLSHLDF